MAHFHGTVNIGTYIRTKIENGGVYNEYHSRHEDFAEAEDAICEEMPATTKDEELCHFIFPGLDEQESVRVHHQIKDLVCRFSLKDICAFLRSLEKEKKILLPQIPQNAFDELHRMGLPPEETKGYSYDNFCKFYRI